MSCYDPFCSGKATHTAEFDDDWDEDRETVCEDCAEGMKRLEGVTVTKGAVPA